MKIINGRADAPSILQTSNFTGEVRADPVLTGEPNASVHHVTFAPRGRTFWHAHGDGQVLLVTAGAGVVVSRRTGRVDVRAGDVVWTEPGEEHWHGAGPDTLLAHTAISLGSHTWLEEVTDAEYDAVLDA